MSSTSKENGVRRGKFGGSILLKYPAYWKIANVLSLFKKGDKSIASNYRPIALLSCVGKVEISQKTATVIWPFSKAMQI
jgi:hypothetical protein